VTDWLDRTNLLLGPEKLKKLKNANVLVVGLGGVGAFAAEMICRAGVGKMTIADGDTVDTTNRNRQLPALVSTTDKPKTEVVANRLRDINPDLELTTVFEFIRDEKAVELLKSQQFDYVVDAIDTLSPKVFLIHHCMELGLNLVSSMGAGGKMNPSQIKVADISKSYNCKLARMIRKRLAKLGVKNGFKVVFSSEEVNENAIRLEESQNKKSAVGTISYMPAVFGCFAASVVISDLAQ
jgi:tRNA A37 threonylcarbamoyladenosine dehydratase